MLQLITEWFWVNKVGKIHNSRKKLIEKDKVFKQKLHKIANNHMIFQCDI